jgi:M3 family oligoendopeptidase
MQFKDYAYKRPDMDKMKEEFHLLLDAFKAAESVEEQNDVMAKINVLRNDFETMENIVYIRHSVDTLDKFYEEEQNFIDENNPLYQELVTEFYKVLVNSKFRNELEAKWGKHIFNIADMALKTFDSSIIELMQKENKLASEYMKLRASAKIMFDGEEKNLSQMGPYAQSEDRNIRKEALKAVDNFFCENESEFDRIYDEQVKVRTEIARTLGFENYVELGYMRLQRADYDSKMVANYRKQVYENLVPLARELRQRQAKRLNLESLKYFDEPLEFLTGNAKPQGEPAWIIENGKQMYKELSKETDEFFSFMLEGGLLDLEAKKGKAGGGYCTFIPNYKAPFIFSNFNGTSGDVDVLTHEAGHAFQVYSSRNFELPEYTWPTLEACEIHSMSMEFIAWPWMENFFKHEVDKYKFSHLSSALLFIPYGVTVDEFQHFVYENPDASPDERKAKWREIEKKYLPHRDYEGYDFLEKGTYWFRQGHIFSNPFYYIDYTLAQVCAFEFWSKSRENRESAWADYTRLCDAGGSMSFLNLVDLAKLHNPFNDGTIKKIVDPIKAWLDQIDDSKL